MSKYRLNRTIYRLYHGLSERGKVGYVGKDSYHPSRLSLCKRSKEVGCRRLHAALNKYPFKFWKKEVLEQGFKTEEELNKSEIWWIAYLNAKEKGYNLTGGGEGTANPSDETRKRMSEVAKERPAPIGALNHFYGQKHSDETKKRISESRKGKNLGEEHPMWGREHSVESRHKMSLSRTGKKFPSETRLKMSLAQKKRWSEGRFIRRSHAANFTNA